MWAQTPNLAAGRTGNPVLLAQLGGLRNSSMLTGHHDLAVARDGPDGLPWAITSRSTSTQPVCSASLAPLGRCWVGTDLKQTLQEARGGKLGAGTWQREPRGP
jgi:hypothetical protein